MVGSQQRQDNRQKDFRMYLISNSQMASIIRLLKMVQLVPGRGSVVANKKRIARLLISELSKKTPTKEQK